MFGWIKESAVYEVGYISNDSWDEKTSSYQVDIPEVVLFEASTVIEKGYLFLIHGTIEASDGTTEILLQANKLEKQRTDDGIVIFIGFTDGSTLTEGLLTIPYSEEGGSGIKNIWDSTGEGAVAGGSIASIASGNGAFAFGGGATASGPYSSAIGAGVQATSQFAHAEGSGSRATSTGSHAEGSGTHASGSASHAEGAGTTSSGDNSHAEGAGTTSSGKNSHAEGSGTKAFGLSSHAEGYNTEAGASESNNSYNHAEGYSTKAVGQYCHTEGFKTNASGSSAHAEGSDTTASGDTSHAEGYYTTASGISSHAEGSNTIAGGSSSHAEGTGTIAIGGNQHVGGFYNATDTQSLEIIGNGMSTASRSNARKLERNGDEWLAGQIQPELGLRLKAPNGTYYNVTVDNTGALSITAVT